MPRSFLVRKKSGSQAARSWTPPPHIPRGEVRCSEHHQGQRNTPEGNALFSTPGEARLESHRRQSHTESKEIKTVAPEVVNSVTDKVTPEVIKTVSDRVAQEVIFQHGHSDHFRPTAEFLARASFNHVPLMPRLVPVPWNHHFMTEGHLSPLFHAHAPVVQPLPVMFPSLSRALILQGCVYNGNNTSPLRVISPTEIPSPSSSSTMTDHDDRVSYSSGSPIHLPTQTLNNQPLTVSQSPIQFPRIGVNVTSQAKKFLGKTVEVINNGFGIKNPVFTDDDSRPLHADITAKDSSYGHLVTSEMCNICMMCGMKVDSSKQLQKHMKTHKEVKRFLCTVCGKGFNDTFDLKRHTRTHTGVRPYKCEQCGKAFTQRCSLESHVRKIHGIQLQHAFNERRMKMYVCEECGNSTTDPEEHYLHLRTQHPRNPALLRCHDRRQFKFRKRKYDCLDTDFQEQRVC